MINIAHFFLSPLAYEFMQRALFMSLLIAIVCSIFSCFLVLKGWSLMGDAISHAILPGLCFAFLLGIPLQIGSFFTGLFCALSMGYLKNHSRIKEDAIMGIVFSGLFALGLVLITKIKTDIHLMHILFGNVLGITNTDLISGGALAIFCSIIMLIKRKDFMLYCFDPIQAKILGMSTKLLHFTLLVLLSLTIVASLQAAGIILVVAMLIAPGAIGFLLTNRFDIMLLIALSASIFSCLLGTILSFHINAATAPLIIIIQAILFLFSFLYKIYTSN